MKDDIEEISVNLIALNIQKTLAKEGYLMSRKNPFYNWMHSQQVIADNPEELGLRFYIANPPVPPVSPFDLAAVLISFETQLSGIYFELTHYFYTYLEPCIEVNDVRAVYSKHDNIWFTKLSEYFTEIKDSFNLSWDTEYDESIEDNLYGNISLEKAENIHLIMKALKLQYEQWSKKEYKTNEHKR